MEENAFLVMAYKNIVSGKININKKVIQDNSKMCTHPII